MSNMDYVEKMFENIKNEQEKKKEEQREEFIDELSGLYRRMWRGIRAGLLDEGVPQDLVDDATLAFVKSLSHGK